MTKFKVNGLQIENKRTQSYKNPVTVNWVHEYKLQGNAVASVEGANGNVKIDIETLSEDTQKRLEQLLKDIEAEVNGEKLTEGKLAVLHKGDLILNEKQTKDVLQTAEQFKGISISNEDKSENITLTEGKIYHAGEIKPEQIKKRNLKDQTINVTVNIDRIEGNETDVNKLVSKIEEEMRKNHKRAVENAKEFGSSVSNVITDVADFANDKSSNLKEITNNLKELLKDIHEYCLEDDKTLFRIQKISLQ